MRNLSVDADDYGSQGGRRRSTLHGLSISGGRGQRADGKVELTEEKAPHVLGFAFPTWKKWLILCVVFTVQMSMNFNTSVFPNGYKKISAHFGVPQKQTELGQMIFLISYAFGCELWAPYSEEFGRWPIMQMSCFLINVWQIMGGLAPSHNYILATRFFGGLSTAGGSVTLGMCADLFHPDKQQYAVAFIVLSSVGGAVIGPIFGCFIEEYLSWQWIFWVQLIFGSFTQAIHFFVPETRNSILLDREAKRRRKTGEDPNCYGPSELKEKRLDLKEFLLISVRPFEMFVREPIVLLLSLFSGFADAFIFTAIKGFSYVFKPWNFSTIDIGMTFVAIWVAYMVTYAVFIPRFKWEGRRRAQDEDSLLPEARLWLLLWIAPLLTIGLFIMAWTSTGPPIHWMGPLSGAFLIAMANYAIYMATIDYMVAAYGPYSASATGGNGFARDFLAGICTLYADPRKSYDPLSSSQTYLKTPR